MCVLEIWDLGKVFEEGGLSAIICRSIIKYDHMEAIGAWCSPLYLHNGQTSNADQASDPKAAKEL